MKFDKSKICTVLICVLVGLIFLPGGDGVELLRLPFTLAGAGLRALSLSGGLGNVMALGLYVLVCLSPLALKGKRRWERGDGWLVLCAGTMFAVLYLMINPGLRPAMMRNDVGELVYAGAVYSILLAWAVGRLLKATDSMGVSGIYGALRMFLIICAVELALQGVVVGAVDLADRISALRDANTMPGADLTMTYLFQTLAYAASALEYGLDAVVMWFGVKLLKQVELDAYSDECVRAGAVLQEKCRLALTVIVGMTAVMNVSQALAAQWLYDVDSSLRIPVFSLALVFGALALTRLLDQGKAIKDDNDLFV